MIMPVIFAGFTNAQRALAVRKRITFGIVALLSLWGEGAWAGNSFEGIIKPMHEVELAFPLDGVIAKNFVKEGSRVRRGEKLIQLDDALQKLEVSRREAIYLDRAEIDSNKKNLPILKGQFDASQDLYQKSAAVSHDEVQNLEMQYYTLAGKIEVAEARKTQEKIESDIARDMLTRYLLTAPINGIVTLLKHEEGEWAKSGETIVTVVDTSTCYAEFNVEEQYARTLKVDKTVSLRVPEGGSQVARSGRVIYIAPVADKASALVRVKVEFENKNGKVVPGVLGQINF